MQIQTFQSDAGAVRYFSFGNPAGQPMVIIPGVAVRSVMESADLIAGQYHAFADDFHIFVIDRRTNISADYHIREMAADVTAVLDGLAIRNADLYGVSQGGMIAQVIAGTRPDLVRKLVLCATAARVTEQAAGILDEWDRLAAMQDTESLALSFAKHIYTPAYCEQYRDAFIAFGKTVSAEELQRFRYMISGMGLDCRPLLREIHCPVLVIGAAHDRIFGMQPAAEIAALTHGSLYIYKHEAHGVYDENPDILLRIKAFLKPH